MCISCIYIQFRPTTLFQQPVFLHCCHAHGPRAAAVGVLRHKPKRSHTLTSTPTATHSFVLSSSSLTLMPPNSGSSTLSPSFTLTGTREPSSVRRPGPVASTMPSFTLTCYKCAGVRKGWIEIKLAVVISLIPVVYLLLFMPCVSVYRCMCVRACVHARQGCTYTHRSDKQANTFLCAFHKL